MNDNMRRAHLSHVISFQTRRRVCISTPGVYPRYAYNIETVAVLESNLVYKSAATIARVLVCRTFFFVFLCPRNSFYSDQGAESQLP